MASCLSHQDGVLHIVAQQARVVESVLGFLQSGVNGAFLDLVLNGSEQFVQRLACRVLVHTQTHMVIIDVVKTLIVGICSLEGRIKLSISNMKETNGEIYKISLL